MNRATVFAGTVERLALTVLAATSVGCVPNLNVGGAYFPPSLVSALIGLGVGYSTVRFLSRYTALRPLAQSALFFLSLAVIAGSLAWWGLYRDF